MNENFEFQPLPETWPISQTLPDSLVDDSVQESEGSSRPGDMPDESPLTEDWADYFAKEAVVNMRVPTNAIRPVPGVDDFTTPTTSDRPIVWRTEDAWYGLDGMNIVHAAIQAGCPHIESRVHFIANCTEEDLAFGKAAMRMKPEGGPASYAELIAASASVAGIYTLNRPSMFRNHHGGLRVPGQNSSQADDDLVNAMCRRLGRGRKTILKNLNHCEFLESAILGRLAAERVGKGFFQSIQQAKNKIVAKLISRGLEAAEIAAQVSEAVGMLLDDFLENGGKIEQETIDSIVALYTADPIGAGQQEPEAEQEPEAQPQATPEAEPEPETEPQQQPEPAPAAPHDDGPALEHQEVLQLEEKKDEVTNRLSDLASQATTVTDNTGMKTLACSLLTYAVTLCRTELSPQEFDEVMEELRAGHLG
jgi:hypothetical protein